MTELSIISLRERPDLAGTCAAWSFGQWDCLKKARQLKSTIERYERTATASNEELPQTWVGLVNDKTMGMISLKVDDHPDRKDLTPWIASFFIHPDFRGNRYSYPMMNRAEAESKTLGFKTLYLYTPDQENLYQKMGWNTFGQESDPTGVHKHVVLMKKELS